MGIAGGYLIPGGAIPVLNAGYVALDDTMGDDRTAARCARTSFANAQNERTEEQDGRLTRYLVRKRHTTPLEFCQLRYYIKAPLFVIQQILRHRTASVNQISHRYVTAKPEFYIPSVDRMVGRAKDVKQGSGGEVITDADGCLDEIQYAYKRAFDTYEELLLCGLAPEIARTVLPVGTYSEMYWQNDLHNTMGFLRLRLADDAQYETKMYARAMLRLAEERFPTAIMAWKEGWSDDIKTGDV